MNKKTKGCITVLLAAWIGAIPVVAQQAKPHAGQDEHAKHTVVLADQVQWKPGPDSLPSGAQFVVLEGDPSKEGAFTMRLKLPSNYRIPPHTHPKVERVTVLQGSFRLGSGRHFDEQKMQRLTAGSFFIMPPGMEHYAATDQETIVQLNGFGPWGIQYINPADDPRKKRN
jgi:quercetin dioxygenase-like cupin family protein